MAKYHKYIFDEADRKFIGKFDEMYNSEIENGYDSWQQDDSRFIDRKFCLDILEQYNFTKILDIGCGKGSFTQYLKKNNNDVTAIDLSDAAIKRARARYPDIKFEKMDITQSDWVNGIEEEYELITCLETLSYIECWPRLIKDFSRMSKYTLIKLFIPKHPIGFVNTMDELTNEFAKTMRIIEEIRLITRKHIILFGCSYNFGN